jgi:anti-anti-sigma factor
MQRFHDAEVDADHDRIISRFDELFTEARRGGACRETVAGLLRELHHYLTEHFRLEEGLMAGHRYPDLAGHRQAHQAMREEFERTLEPLLQDGQSLGEEVRLLRDLFLAHIVTWDDAFGGWLQDRRSRPSRPAGVSRPLEGAMKITIDNRQDITIICPEGKITLGDGDQELGEAVRTQLEQGARKIVVDFSHVTYLDSSGLGELVGCYTSIRTRGGDLKVCGVNSRVFNLMKLTSLHSVFDVRDTEEQALAAF